MKLKLVLFLCITLLLGMQYSQELGKNVKIEGNTSQLSYFENALNNADNEKVRIAHFGDSILLGDVISEYLRHYLQERYGGEGVGLVDIYSKANLMRRSIKHTFSDNWESIAVNTRNPDDIPVGFSGSVSIAGNNSWVKIANTRFISSNGSFTELKIFYSNAPSGAIISADFGGGNVKNVSLTNTSSIQELLIDAGTSVNSVKVTIKNGKGTNFYGISLEKGNGVYLDNLPISGNSGVSLIDIPDKTLEAFSKLNYKLIILNYGVNVSTPNRAAFRVYENKMQQVIRKFKKYFPETSFLIVSVADKTVKRSGNFVTDRNIPMLIRTQEKIARKSQVAFWNLFEVMGGENSMNTWVSHAPPYALKDYTHFTHEGGKRVAELLINALLSK